MTDNLKAFLDAKVTQYNQPGFIANDPVCIPHMFSKKQDIEIMGFWAATLAWGQRVTIIKKCKELIALMDGAPYDFIINHEEPDLKKLLSFKHRTFNDVDTLYFIHFFRQHYERFESLEDAFTVAGHFEPVEGNSGGLPAMVRQAHQNTLSVETALNRFRSYFMSLPDFPQRTKKHVSSPSQNSTCKRLNMFLRWMVRKDNNGVDFGIWNNIKPA
ncbi:MAG: DUF2400 domain-containing protein, partial [Sphingobacteriaceae bacterium]